MSDIQQMTRLLAPILMTMTDEPFWVTVSRPAPGREPSAAEEPLGFWSSTGFENWCPTPDCRAIIAVTPTTAFDVEVGVTALSRRPSRRKRKRAWVICAVSEEGEAYATLVLPGGRPLAEGVPEGGLLLDVMLAKFGLPPGPPCPYDLQLPGPPYDRRLGPESRGPRHVV